LRLHIPHERPYQRILTHVYAHRKPTRTHSYHHFYIHSRTNASLIHPHLLIRTHPSRSP
jgi:hypothetical protein